jgi:hypothetical protein
MPTFLSRKYDIDEISNSELELLTRPSAGQQVEMFSRAPSSRKINVYQLAEDDSGGKDEHLRKPGHFAAGSCNPFITRSSKLKIVSPFYFAHLVFFLFVVVVFREYETLFIGCHKLNLFLKKWRDLCNCAIIHWQKNVPALQLEPTSVHDNCQKSFLSAQL